MYLEHDIFSIKGSMELALVEYLDITKDWDQRWLKLKEAMNAGDHNRRMEAGRDVRDMASKAEAKKVSFILSCAALTEAIVNLIFTLKLSKHQFDAIDKCRLLQKWVEIVPLVVSGFSIDRGGRTYQLLDELIFDRNRITHMKPRAKEDSNGPVLHEGYLPKHSTGKLPEVIEKMKEWHELPRVLIEQVKKADNNLGSQLELFCWYM